ncbi:MAG: type I methionyl aminopeptidase [Prevotellaceae bacterium]|nr:type I methionyl aminopeptidase [Prevotellaceae bacterium]
MSKLRNNEEIEILRENALLVSKTLAEIAKYIKPGVATIKLDKIAEQFIRDHEAEPGFLGYNGFPNTLCISVNSVVVHGIPSEYVLQEGDIVSVDCGTRMKGYYGDSAYTFAVGRISPEAEMLLKVTKESLFKGIEQAVEGNHMGDVSYAIQNYVEGYGFSVVREMVGHAIGQNMHERPDVPNYGKRGSGKKLAEGMVICIEPMINAGSKEIYQERDGWTIRTADKHNSAHYELTVAVRKGKTDVLSTFDYVEEVLKQKEQ